MPEACGQSVFLKTILIRPTEDGWEGEGGSQVLESSQKFMEFEHNSSSECTTNHKSSQELTKIHNNTRAFTTIHDISHDFTIMHKGIIHSMREKGKTPPLKGKWKGEFFFYSLDWKLTRHSKLRTHKQARHETKRFQVACTALAPPTSDTYACRPHIIWMGSKYFVLLMPSF